MIRAEDVKVVFRTGFRKRLNALEGFSLSVEEGDIFALLGPNGAGKSTAMYCFLGLVHPRSGSITVMGQSPVPGSKVFRRIGYLPEEPHYHGYLTVREAVEFYVQLYGEKVPAKMIDAAIDRVGLNGYQDLKLDKCSKGMKQKTGIAQCIVLRPDLLMLDEPTRGLDPIMVKEFREIIMEMNREGTTVVLNSHVLSEIEMVCTHAAIINKGRVVRHGTLDELRGDGPGTYSVLFAPAGEVPSFVAHQQRNGPLVSGIIPGRVLGDFMRYVNDSGSKLHECSITKQSLESVLLDTLEGEAE
ncbi:MAG: ABC transporter ATP-binding protein [Thermodesulfovibrionales bacterium]|nr:ABC transporter ATP-binding protein [Thermodesulfovibrionales bacterium]